MTDLTPEREQEIRETHPGDLYDGAWTQDYVEAAGDEPAYNKVVHHESGTVLATLPDFAGPIALFIADAHDSVPELLREIDSLRKQLDQAENDTIGANLARWEEEQDNQRLRLALKSAQRGRRDLRAHSQLASRETPDTLPTWLYQRFGKYPVGVDWDELPESDQEYWAHEASAVRRAVARGGFKNPEDQPSA